MPNDPRTILNAPSDCLSNEEMRRYLEGDPEVQRRVEQHLVDCEFCNEALEGFMVVPAFDAVQDINTEVRSRAAQGHGSQWGLVAGILGVSVIIAGIFLLTDEVVDAPVADQPLVEETIPNEVITEERSKMVEDGSSGEALEPVTEAEPPVDESILKATIAEQPEVTTDANEVERIVRGPGPEKIVIKRTEKLNAPSDAEDREKRPKVWSNVHVAFVHDLLVVDYSKILTSGVSSLEEHLGSTHPQYENKQDRTIITFEPRSYDIPYLDYMEEAMLGFARGNPRATFDALKRLLEQHDGDVNGLFYSGLCLYHLERADLAIPYFDQAIASSINTFYEESRWYKALSHHKLGQQNMAKALMEEIAAEGGFYAERAKSELAEP